MTNRSTQSPPTQSPPTQGPQDTVTSDIRSALKAGLGERVATLRMLLSEIHNERIRQQEEVDEQTFLRLVRRAVKQRQESASQYQDGGRDELASKERREIEILSEYLPAEVDEDELTAAIAEIISAGDLAGPAAMGPIMRQMMERYGGRADGGRISQLARQLLSGN